MSRVLIGLFCVLFGLSGIAQKSVAQRAERAPDPKEVDQAIDALKEPLYSPFIERYVLDELKQLRIDMDNQRTELIQNVVNREHSAVDRAITYATDTITYFFYTIAAASTILVLVGWSSIREIKDRVHVLADEQVSKLVDEYEQRLRLIEQQLRQKTQHIEQNREEIERTQEVQSLWLRAAQEESLAERIQVYDQILKLRNDDVDALSYKADAVLELGEPQWAVNLCLQVLSIDPSNSHAFYLLARSCTALHRNEEAVDWLSKAIEQSESYRESISQDPTFEPLHELDAYRNLMGSNAE